MTKLITRKVGRGPDIVLLHGWGLNSGVWTSLVDSLSAHFCVHLIDLPGFGVNHTVMPANYELDDVAGLIEAVLPQNSIVLGWSLGGLIAQHIAARQHVELKHLVLVGSTPRFLEGDDWPGIKPHVLKAFNRQLAQNFELTLERFLAIQAMGSPTVKSDIKHLQQAILNYPQPAFDALVGGLKLLETVDLRNHLAAISIPITRIYGRLDSLVPEKVSDLVHAMTPGAQVEAKSHVLPHASHAPFISHPEDFRKLLLNALLGESE